MADSPIKDAEQRLVDAESILVGIEAEQVVLHGDAGYSRPVVVQARAARDFAAKELAELDSASSG